MFSACLTAEKQGNRNIVVSPFGDYYAPTQPHTTESKVIYNMTTNPDYSMSNDITELKRKLAEQDEIIRELNERASSHLITMLNTVQKLKLENDMMNAKLRQKNQ